MADETTGMDNCANCGLELAPQAPPRDPCPKCGATGRIVNLGAVTMTAESSFQVKPEAQTIYPKGIPSEESVGSPSVTATPLRIEYESDVFMFELARLTRASFIGVCESDSHDPFVIGGSSREQVLAGLNKHVLSEH